MTDLPKGLRLALGTFEMLRRLKVRSEDIFFVQAVNGLAVQAKRPPFTVMVAPGEKFPEEEIRAAMLAWNGGTEPWRQGIIDEWHRTFPAAEFAASFFGFRFTHEGTND